MNYIEYTFVLDPLIPARDILVVELAEIGFESFVETDNGLQAYIRLDEHNADRVSELTVGTWPDQSLTMSVLEIQDQNWNAEWEKNFDPIMVEDRCIVRAPFHEARPEFPMEIVIEPKMSFGTGHHATTWLILRALFDLELAGKQVLDMGSGTAVLAILAEKLGATHVDAIDNDEWAYSNALENVERNHCLHIVCILGDAAALGEKSYDVIIANINRNILTRDASVYLSALSLGGLILLSGFYVHDIPILLEAFDGCEEVRRDSREDWAMLTLRKKD